MLTDWLIDIASVDQQCYVSDAIYQLCQASSWNAMQCSKAAIIMSIVRCLQRSASSSSSTLDMSVVGESCVIVPHDTVPF